MCSMDLFPTENLLRPQNVYFIQCNLSKKETSEKDSLKIHVFPFVNIEQDAVSSVFDDSTLYVFGSNRTLSRIPVKKLKRLSQKAWEIRVCVERYS